MSPDGNRGRQQGAPRGPMGSVVRSPESRRPTAKRDVPVLSRPVTRPAAAPTWAQTPGLLVSSGAPHLPAPLVQVPPRPRPRSPGCASPSVPVASGAGRWRRRTKHCRGCVAVGQAPQCVLGNVVSVLKAGPKERVSRCFEWAGLVRRSVRGKSSGKRRSLVGFVGRRVSTWASGALSSRGCLPDAGECGRGRTRVSCVRF